MLIGDLVWLTQTLKSIVWAVHTLAQRGDCRASVKQMEKNTDRRNQAAYKKSLTYTSSSVNAGITIMDLIPRDNNLGDNHTQQGSPYERWHARSNTIMGVNPEVHVSEGIREMLRFHRDRDVGQPTR